MKRAALLAILVAAVVGCRRPRAHTPDGLAYDASSNTTGDGLR